MSFAIEASFFKLKKKYYERTSSCMLGHVPTFLDDECLPNLFIKLNKISWRGSLPDTGSWVSVVLEVYSQILVVIAFGLPSSPSSSNV